VRRKNLQDASEISFMARCVIELPETISKNVRPDAVRLDVAFTISVLRQCNICLIVYIELFFEVNSSRCRTSASKNPTFLV